VSAPDSATPHAPSGPRDADAARRAHLRSVLLGLTEDLRTYAEQARAAGADALPAASSQAVRAAHRPIQVTAPPPPSAHRAPPHTGAPSASPSRGRSPQASPPAKTAPPRALPGETLADIRADLGACARCPLSQTRRNLVFGVGPAHARVVLVGEGPGRDEDATGEPFVGRAGRLLNRMLESIGLSRREVYITNVLKCRPPNNRDPEPGEVATCSPFLHRQLRAIAPSAILTLGRFAAANITGLEGSMASLRRDVHEAGGVPIVSTYHPAYLLRRPAEKAKAWEDLLKLRALLRRGTQP